jgi:hypothetical protein
MDYFLFVYLLMLVVGALSFVAFWGAVIYLGIKLFRSNNLSNEQKLKIASGVLGAYSGRSGPYEPGPRDAEVRSMAASEGINLDR